MNAELRERWGRVVRQAWVGYCVANGDTKPSHIAPWEELSEFDREADRVIGETMAEEIIRELFGPGASMSWGGAPSDPLRID